VAAATAPPWQSDYHLNINLQMNYWPAEGTNLAETAELLFGYVDALREPGWVTARRLYGVGWPTTRPTSSAGPEPGTTRRTSSRSPARGWPASSTTTTGATSGMTEMLLRSQLGVVDVLPALPGVWPSGRVDGLRARGAVTVGVTWRDSVPSELRLDTRAGGDLTVRSAMFSEPVRVYRDGWLVRHSVDGDQLTFTATRGASYRIAPAH
jgi:hypothetical protein